MKKWIKLTAAILFVIMGGAGCMSSESKVMEHLEEKYGEKFEVESTKEGSVIFPDMYGKDKVIAHQEGKPELVFLAGESRNEDGVYYDTFILSIWSNQLDQLYQDKVKQAFNEDVEFKTMLFVEEEKYAEEKKDSSVTDFLQRDDNGALLTLNIAVKTDGEPEVEKYLEPVYELLNELRESNAKYYGVTVGFVDSSENVSDYMRTSNINNIDWSNLDAKVYGTIMVDDSMDISSPEQIKEYYQPLEG
ncbi:hypothetical protein [Mesobacillus jeotgali]|uniref:hypothetical protein n=1 Tax=Mesobacillus jeotgali TaxID=129985 RepID=UPI001CFCDF05|nr:hypothetical protein [Mesobacillus jeotgali]